MPFTFDFGNGGGTNGGPGFGTSGTLSNDAGGVRFTISSDGKTDSRLIQFLNGANGGFALSDSGSISPTAGGSSNNVFTLSFQSLANSGNTRISGTITSPIALQVDFARFVWDIDFLTTGGGTVAGQIFTDQLTGTTVTAQASNVNGIRFTSLSSGFDSIIIGALSGKELNCFCAGTRIATPEGGCLVEELASGDQVVLAGGETSTVRWVGEQRIDTRLSHPSLVNPIRITAGAFGPGLPERDLLVSKDHGIGLGGALINAGALVNGETIYQEPEMPDAFTYLHVDTGAHELLLAEGLAAESFADARGRVFDNAESQGEVAVIQEMDLPRVSSARFVPDHLRPMVRKAG